MDDTMRDLLSKLDSILSETELRDKEDLQAKRKALQDLQMDPNSSDPEIKQAIIQRKAELEREAKEKGFTEGIQVGDEFGISFSEDFEIGAEVVGFVEDGIVIELDDTAISHLTENGIKFLEGELTEGLRDPKDNPCWKGYKPVGTKKKGGKTVPNCVPKESMSEATGDAKFDKMMGNIAKGAQLEPNEQKFIQRHEQLLNKLGKLGEIIVKNPEAWKRYENATSDGEEIDSLYHLIEKYTGASRKELEDLDSIVDGFGTTSSGLLEFAWAVKEGRWEDDFIRPWEEYKMSFANVDEDHGPEDPTADYNQGEYDREGDMAKDQLRTIDSAAEELYAIIGANENLPEWVQAKITKAMDYIDTVRDYMKANKYEEDVNEAEYQGRKVQLGKKMAGDVKKYKVYVRKPNGNIVKVNFGDKKMRIKKSNPARRKSFRARHNCSNPGPRWKARYWSCRNW